MLTGVIDLGSNTIRLSIYKCTKGKFSLLLNEKSFAGLAGYVQNGRLSAAGMALACETIGKYKKLCRSLNVSGLQVFATACIRVRRRVRHSHLHRFRRFHDAQHGAAY